MALVITDANFEELSKSNELLVVDVWATWCGPCRALAPVIDELSRQYEGKAAIGKVDADENPEICEKFGVRNLPTILFIKNGEVADKVVGALAKNALSAKIDSML